MNKKVKYEVLSKLPIKAVVDANSTSATLCWEYKAIISSDTQCSADEVISTHCENIPLSANPNCSESITNGQITWKENTIGYTITQLVNTENCGCEKPFEGTKYALLDYWVEPTRIECNDNAYPSTTKLFYKYELYRVDSNTCEIKPEEITTSTTINVTCNDVEKVTRSSASTVVEIKDGNEKIGEENINYGYVCVPCDEGCDVPVSIKIGNIIYDKEYIICTGDTVGYTIEYVKIVTDEECKKHKTYGSVNGSCKFSACTNYLDSICCVDHYVTEEVEFKVDGETKKVTLSILMLGDFDGSCDSSCIANNCNCNTIIIDGGTGGDTCNCNTIIIDNDGDICNCGTLIIDDDDVRDICNCDTIIID